MIPFGRELKLGSTGHDCVAVKRALARAGHGSLGAKGTWTPVFGPFAVQNLKAFCGKSKYDKHAHKKLEPYFDLYSQHLYKVPTDPALAKARAMRDFGYLFHKGYVYGGEHDSTVADDNPNDYFDCSSSVSFMLWKFGLFEADPDLIDPAQVSGWFESWGEADRGKYVTLHANADHVWIEFDLPEGYFRFDTSPHGDGPRGPRIRTKRRFDSTFVHRHPKGM